jgi:preprotein translocase subunit SecA
MEMIESAVRVKLEEFLPADDPERHDTDALIQWVTRQCAVDVSHWPRKPEEMDAQDLEEAILESFRRSYDAREAEVGAEMMRQIERLILLDRIDHHWMEHLQNIDYVRDGIGFRGYAGRDPVVEFQKEGFELFESMLGRIDEEVAQYIFRVQIQMMTPAQAEAYDEAQRAAEEGKGKPAPATPAQSAALNRFQRAAKAAAQSQFPKVGRNDPCPCGSGKKYKLCHGRIA